MRAEFHWLALAALGVAAWWYAGKAREQADVVANRLCTELHCQRLDQAVSLARVRLARGAHGVTLRRVYRFEFSTTGADRRVGEIGLDNGHARWARLDHPDGPLHIDLGAARGSA
ncbi:MAG: DUF3301 domain-containing protein [Gammaproteobacteria bacterium]